MTKEDIKKEKRMDSRLKISRVTVTMEPYERRNSKRQMKVIRSKSARDALSELKIKEF